MALVALDLRWAVFAPVPLVGTWPVVATLAGAFVGREYWSLLRRGKKRAAVWLGLAATATAVALAWNWRYAEGGAALLLAGYLNLGRELSLGEDATAHLSGEFG